MYANLHVYATRGGRQVFVRCIVRFMAVASALAASARSSVARGDVPHAARSHAVSTTADGLILTLQTPSAAYPPDALVSVTVRLRNLSNAGVRLEMCAQFLPLVQMLDSAGQAAPQPPIPTGIVRPACFDPTPPVSLPIGQTLTWTGLMILRAPRLRAIATIYGKRTEVGLFGAPSRELQTPILRLGTAPEVRTRASIATTPRLHATVQAPASRQVYYTDRVDCTDPYRGAISGGTTGWTATGGRSIEPSVVENCPRVSRWRLTVAVVGQAPIWLDHRLAPPAIPAAGIIAATRCASSPPRGAGAVAATWHGSAYLVTKAIRIRRTIRAANGITRANDVAANSGYVCRLTAPVRANGAWISPTGRWVAYAAPVPGHHMPTVLWLVPTDGGSAPRRVLGTKFHAPSASLLWSPNGQLFTYQQQGTIIVRTADGRRPQVAIPNDGRYGASSLLTWSPDGSRVAVAVGVSAEEGVRTLRLAVGRANGSGSTTSIISFPTWISTPSGVPHGSFPWSDVALAADGRHVFLTTTGGGVRLSGVWEAPWAGGPGRLVLGSQARVQGHPAPVAHLDGATHLFASPDGRYLVVDPRAGFWVEDTRTLRGRLLPVPPRPDCVVSQSVWTAGGDGVTFVQTCSLSGASAFRSTVWRVSLHGGAPRQLLTIVDRLPDAISIGPVYRCVRCGFNPGP